MLFCRPNTLLRVSCPPASLLMRSLNKPYYIGLLSAATLHGASRQQPMEYFVGTGQPTIRKIIVNSKV